MMVDANDLGEGLRLLTLNRPPANAISKDFLDALYDRCRDARDDKSVRAVIVTGAGKFFSGGFDIKEAVRGESRVSNLAGHPADGIFALWTLPKPTVAMVNGHSIAGGIIIGLACDFRITCSGSHKFGLNEIAIGLPLPPGPVEIAKLALSSHGLRYALLEAALHGPARARELGFVDEVVDPSRLESRCVELAKRLASVAQPAYAYVKEELQRDAVARTLNFPNERSKALAAVGATEESREMLRRQVGSISRD
ncbi:MAG: enoyl-CoA hydratase/isomerase family protein [Candidatus Binataceae bacterium]